MKSSTQMFEPKKLTGIWFEWAEEMYAKSAIKYFVKRLPIDSSVMDAIIQDEEGERDAGDASSIIDTEIIPPNQSPVLKKGKDIQAAIASMGLSLYPFEGKVVVEGNTFKYASALQELGFLCSDGEWSFEFESISELVEALFPKLRVDEKDGWLAIKGKQSTDIESTLVDLGFTWFEKKALYACKISEKKAA